MCSSHIETQHYSSVLVHFLPVYFYCSQGEETLIENEKIMPQFIPSVSCAIVMVRDPTVSSHPTWLKDAKHDFTITSLSATVLSEYIMCTVVLVKF